MKSDSSKSYWKQIDLFSFCRFVAICWEWNYISFLKICLKYSKIFANLLQLWFFWTVLVTVHSKLLWTTSDLSWININLLCRHILYTRHFLRVWFVSNLSQIILFSFRNSPEDNNNFITSNCSFIEVISACI